MNRASSASGTAGTVTVTVIAGNRYADDAVVDVSVILLGDGDLRADAVFGGIALRRDARELLFALSKG